MGFFGKHHFSYHQTFILKIKRNDRIVIAEGVGEEKKTNFLFQIVASAIWQAGVSKDLLSLANPRRASVVTLIGAGKVKSWNENVIFSNIV